MRTVTTTKTLYQFSELSEQAKERAIEDYRDNYNEYFWGDEFRQSLDAFLSTAGVALRNWKYDSYNYDYNIRSDFNEFEQEATGLKLWKYASKQWHDKLNRKKRYAKNGSEWDKKAKRRFSKILWETHDCPFTGICFDEDFLEPIRAFIKNPNSFKGTYEDLMRECLDSGFQSIVKDCEYQQSDEFIIEQLENNDWEFDENGNWE